MTLLAARDLAFAYRRDPVLSGVNLAIARGEMVAMVGPNGAGKSTLLRLLAGFLKPRAGIVAYDGRDLAAWEPTALARRLAVVPQRLAFHFPFTVGQYVLLARHPHRGWSPFESEGDVDAARHALEAVGIADLIDRPVTELSGGEGQRAALAAALAQAPETLLLDEPTASLDLRHQVDLMATLRRENQARGLTVVLVTHDLNLAARHCRRLVLMHRGRIVGDGPPATLLDAANIQRVYDVPVEVGRRADGRTPYLLPLERDER